MKTLEDLLADNPQLNRNKQKYLTIRHLNALIGGIVMGSYGLESILEASVYFILTNVILIPSIFYSVIYNTHKKYYDSLKWIFLDTALVGLPSYILMWVLSYNVRNVLV